MHFKTLIPMLACVPACVLAGVDLSVSPEAATAAVPRLGGALLDPSASSTLSTPNSALLLLANAEEKVVRARLSKRLGDLLDQGDLNLAAALSGVVDRSKDPMAERRTRLGDLNGLAGGAVLQLQAQLLWWRVTTDPEAMSSVCHRYLRRWSCSRAELPSEQAKREMDEAVSYGIPWLLSISGEVGREEYSWIDPITLGQTSGGRTPWSIRFGTGFVVAGQGFIGASYRFLHSFEPGTETLICQPYGGGPSLRCDQAALGAPTVADHDIVALEARLFVGRLGINPRASYDLSRAALGLELPVYFIQNGDHGLTGGVSLGWGTEDHRVRLTFFIGETFGLLAKE